MGTWGSSICYKSKMNIVKTKTQYLKLRQNGWFSHKLKKIEDKSIGNIQSKPQRATDRDYNIYEKLSRSLTTCKWKKGET